MDEIGSPWAAETTTRKNRRCSRPHEFCTGFGPTETSITLLQMIEKDLAAAENEVQTLLEKDVPEFNRSLVDRRITPIISFNNSAPATKEEAPAR